MYDAVPRPVREILEQQAPEFPWDPEAAWQRFWTPARIAEDLKGVRGNAHDAGIWVVIQLWRELMNYPRQAWRDAPGQITDALGRALREGKQPWRERHLQASSIVLQNHKLTIWHTWEELCRDALDRGRFSGMEQRGPLAIDPYLAAMAYANGWIGRRGLMTWDSLVMDGILLVEAGGLDIISPLWKDGGIRMAPVERTPVELRPGCRLIDWMAVTGRTVESLRDEMGIGARQTIINWKNGMVPQGYHLVALKAISGGLIIKESFPRKKPPRLSDLAAQLRPSEDGTSMMLPVGLRKTRKAETPDLEGVLGELRTAKAEGHIPQLGLAVSAHTRPAMRPMGLDVTEMALGGREGNAGGMAPLGSALTPLADGQGDDGTEGDEV
jgi:hypothetical protein